MTQHASVPRSEFKIARHHGPQLARWRCGASTAAHSRLPTGGSEEAIRRCQSVPASSIPSTEPPGRACPHWSWRSIFQFTH